MMCEEMIFEYWFSTIRKLSARKKYLLRELIGSGKKTVSYTHLTLPTN